MNKDSLILGIILSIILPFIGFGFWWMINSGLSAADVMDAKGNIFQFREKTVTLLSICFNLIPFQIAKNKRWDNMLRGVGITTLTFLLYWAYHYGLFGF